ncbi:MAG: NADH-quinone oxidoreductase subunit J [Deltaproteobacteria bacterium]|nr:NADH-quinone oxidoreductase subunit J [Deltaproteobacteria bacterium]
MSIPGAIFYLLAMVVLAATLLAVTSRNLMHAVVHLVISFVGTALLFYLLGAPLLAALEVIVYAGAIMVLFVFIVVTLAVPVSGGEKWRYARQWLPAAVLSLVLLVIMAALIASDPVSGQGLTLASVSPQAFGEFVFRKYWLAVEIVSFLLFVALVGALYLGRHAFRGKKGGVS